VSHWARDVIIAAVALTAGYFIFAPPKPSQMPHVVAEAHTPSIAPKAAPSDARRAVMSAAAIASMLVEESRNAYYASGRPCACPDDLMRNGRRCGGNSAYSKPGGAQPYCYVSDVPPTAIQRHQARLSANLR
jgi:hypothetical protein